MNYFYLLFALVVASAACSTEPEENSTHANQPAATAFKLTDVPNNEDTDETNHSTGDRDLIEDEEAHLAANGGEDPVDDALENLQQTVTEVSTKTIDIVIKSIHHAASGNLEEEYIKEVLLPLQKDYKNGDISREELQERAGPHLKYLQTLRESIKSAKESKVIETITKLPPIITTRVACSKVEDSIDRIFKEIRCSIREHR